MTTFSEIDVACAVCGATSSQAQLSSTNAFGPSDLDLRPPEMQRSTMAFWVQECPGCGHVAHSIAAAPSAAARSVLGSDAYRALIGGERGRTLYSRFRRAFLLAEADGDADRAARMALCAAWAADDAGLEQEARASRRLAARGYAAVIAAGVHLEEEDDEEAAAAEAEAMAEHIATLRLIRIDALRRAGDFEEAAQEAERFAAEAPDGIIADVARFQVGLAKGRDAGCYTVADATEPV